MTDYSDPWWGHISGKCIDDCPWCHINELQAELTALREAASDYQRTVNTWRVIGFGNTGKNAFFSAGDKLAAILLVKA